MAFVNQDSFQLKTIIDREGELFCLKAEENLPVAVCCYQKGFVSFQIWYHFKEQPLVLQGAAQQNDTVCIHVLPYRIELLVQGKVIDEEWPYGSHGLAQAYVTDGGVCRIEPYAEPTQVPEPCVKGTFIQAEGWKPEENVFVGDCMPYMDEGRYHVLYLKDRHHHCSKWGLGAHQWSHISTDDFQTWQIHPMAVAIDAPEEASICTGSWIKHENKHYLYYTIRTCDGSPASICRSISDDGYHFVKDHSFAVLLSERYTGASARDPKIIVDERGLYHMLLTTSLRSEKRGCLAHLTSDDLEHWREESEPIYVSPSEDEPECCDYFFKDGWYYLIFSLRSHGQYLYSRKPFSNWRDPHDQLIPCKSVPKAAIWKDRIIFTGFDGHGHYAGTMTFVEAEVAENGELRFAPLFSV